MPSAVAPLMTLLAIVNVAAAGKAASVVTSMAFRLPSVSPRISAGMASVTVTELPAPPLMTGGAPALAGTRTVGEPLPLRLRGIDRPTGSPIRCWPASSSMPALIAAVALCTKM